MNYSTEEKALIGKMLAELFGMKKADRVSVSVRYHTAWGTKTAVGIFETFKRIGEEMEKGTLTSTLLKG